jgi:protein-S-isoprenylcysteine O-methyltransferase Ste14
MGTGRWLTRVVPVLVFGLLTVAALVHISAGHPSGIAVVGRSAYAVLLVVQVAAFASQPAPTARDGRAGVWTVTLVATFGMVVAPSLPPVRHLWTAGPSQIQAQAILEVGGMAIALWAMATLRKSFSLTPQARRLAATGPYRILRHPLYLGEALNIVGIMVGTGSLTVVVAVVVVVAGEVTRAGLEERLLRRAFPDYATVFMGVAHLVPGVW